MTYVAHEWAREPSEHLSHEVTSVRLTRKKIAPLDLESRSNGTTHFSRAIGLAIALRHVEGQLSDSATSQVTNAIGPHTAPVKGTTPTPTQ